MRRWERSGERQRAPGIMHDVDESSHTCQTRKVAFTMRTPALRGAVFHETYLYGRKASAHRQLLAMRADVKLSGPEWPVRSVSLSLCGPRFHMGSVSLTATWPREELYKRGRRSKVSSDVSSPAEVGWADKRCWHRHECQNARASSCASDRHVYT